MEFTLYQRWAATAVLGLLTAGALVAGYRAHIAMSRAGPSPQAAGSDRPGKEGPSDGGVGGALAQVREPPVPTQGPQDPARDVSVHEGGETTALAGGPPSPSGQETVVVHVAGAVASPGVYRLPPGARVEDAVRAASPLSDAVPDALNLARRLADGEKIFVPSRTSLAPGAPQDPVAVGADHAPGISSAGRPPERPSGAQGASARVNVNTADVAELTSVPGIGPVLAERIVERRRAVGRFRTLDELLEVPGIGTARLEQLRRYLSL